MTRADRQRMNTAIHEAAHAVVAIGLGRRFRAVGLYHDASAPTVAANVHETSQGRVWPDDTLIYQLS
jgi:hypothetical protein